MRIWNCQGRRLNLIANDEEKLAEWQNKIICLGYLEEQDSDYGIVTCFRGFNGAMDIIRDILDQPDLKAATKRRSDRLIKDKCDLTSFMIRFIEEWPKSFDKAGGNEYLYE